MNRFYKIKLLPKSPWQTSLNSDTLAGYLIWLLKYNLDNSEFEEIITKFDKDKPPFVLSDCFPGDSLPAPVSLGSFIRKIGDKIPDDMASHLSRAKWIDREFIENLKMIDNPAEFFENAEISIDTKKSFSVHYFSKIKKDRRSHSLGNRYTVRAKELTNNEGLTLYAFTESKKIGKIIQTSFENMQYHGFGAGASRGYGRFELIDFEESPELFEAETNSAAMAISSFVPKKSDDMAVAFKTFVKSGRIGEKGHDLKIDGNFFKKPIMMVKPGAIFPKYKKPIIGKTVKNISQDSNIFQLCHSLLIPISEEFAKF